MKKIKPYNQVKVGDMAFENPDAGGEWDNEIGEVLWKGTYGQLKKSKYKNTLLDWDDITNESDTETPDLLVIQTTGWDGGPTLFGYNNDPSSCVVFEPETHGTKHLREQSAKLGQILTNPDQLKEGKDYCIVDLGLNEWNSGYRYTGENSINGGGVGKGIADKRMNERTRAVIVKLQKLNTDRNFVSPNYVNDIANDMGVSLTSEEVVYISDNYSSGSEQEYHQFKDTLQPGPALGEDDCYTHQEIVNMISLKLIAFEG